MQSCYLVCIIFNKTLEHLKNHVLDIFQISLYFQEGIFSLKWDCRGHSVHCGGIKPGIVNERSKIELNAWIEFD